jgi:hypothetical protein
MDAEARRYDENGAELFLRSRQLHNYSKIFQSYGKQRFITVFTRALHRSLS